MPPAAQHHAWSDPLHNMQLAAVVTALKAANTELCSSNERSRAPFKLNSQREDRAEIGAPSLLKADRNCMLLSKVLL